MPYIKFEDRDALRPTSDHDAVTPGQLNFQVTTLVEKFVRNHGGGYDAINAAIGALECAKLELYRRVAVPYEDQKAILNGDVY